VWQWLLQWLWQWLLQWLLPLVDAAAAPEGVCEAE
jgi:hypothetical protein